MKAFVIGDVHGCLKELKELLYGIDRTTTRVILVGDLIDRGPDSEAVIEYVRSNQIECVLGNHELMLLECEGILNSYLESDKAPSDRYRLYESDWFYNGGHDVLAQYSSLNQLLTDIKFIKTFPKYIETGIKDDTNLELLVSHTWSSHKVPNIIDLEDFVWDREQPKGIKNTSKYYNIYGHTPVDYINHYKYHLSKSVDPEPEWYDGCAAIDTGCAYNTKSRGTLTGVFFPSLDIKQVKKVF